MSSRGESGSPGVSFSPGFLGGTLPLLTGRTGRGAVLAAVRGEVQKLEADGPIVRLIFPAPKGLADQITSYWHRHKLDSKSAAIRKLIELGLEK